MPRIWADRRARRLGRESWQVAVSLLVSALSAPALVYGLLSPSAYRGLGADIAITGRAQDVLTALVLPVLVGAAFASRRGSLRAHVLWLGLMFYLAYSYAIFLIGWPENRVFLLYVAIVLFSTSALLDGLVRVDVRAVRPAFAGMRTRGVGWFLIVIGVAFIGLWLSDVGPSAFGGRAPLHIGVGLAPYPVYVLDLTVALPTVIATGVLLVRRHPVAVLLAGVVVVKVATLFTALWFGAGAQLLAGRSVALTPDLVPSAILPVVTVVILIRAARRLRQPDADWLRSELWPTTLPPTATHATPA